MKRQNDIDRCIKEMWASVDRIKKAKTGYAWDQEWRILEGLEKIVNSHIKASMVEFNELKMKVIQYQIETNKKQLKFIEG